MKGGRHGRFLKRLLDKWGADEISRRAAALALYTFLSLAPLLFIMVSIVGLIYGEAGAQADIVAQVQDVAGATAASAVRTIVENVGGFKTGLVGTVGGVVLLVLSAIGVLLELQTDLNVIWGVKTQSGPGMKGRLKGLARLTDRVLAFLALLGVGLLLLSSVVATTLVSAFAHRLSHLLPAPTLTLHIADFCVFLAIGTLLMALLFKILPRTKVGHGDLWLGAFVTAFLFGIGKFALGVYLGRAGLSSSYGAAGGFVVLLFWIYYSSQIFLLGAAFTALRAGRSWSKS